MRQHWGVPLWRSLDTFHVRLQTIKNTAQQWGMRPVVRLALVAGLAAAGQLALRHERITSGFVLLGIAALAFAVWTPSAPARTIAVPEAPRLATGFRRTLGIAALIVAGVMLGLAAESFLALPPGEIPGALPWDRYAAGMAFLVFGGLTLTRGMPRTSVRWGTALALALVVGLALFMRLYRLDTQPYGLWYDEAVAGLDARRMLEDPDYRPFFVPVINVAHVQLFTYAVALALGGQTSATALRLVSVAFGVGAVISAYGVGRELRGPRFGLLMAFCMATMSWAVTFSRVAMTGIDVTFFTLSSFYFVLRTVRYRSARDALLAGLSVGIGLWFYSAFRAVLLPLGLFGLVAWRFWEPRSLLLIGVIGVTLLATIFPFGIFAVREPDLFMQRLDEVSIFNEIEHDGRSLGEALPPNIEKHLLMFHVAGDRNGRHNLPGDPMLDPVTGVLFVLGLGAALLRRPRGDVLFFAVLLVVSLAGGIFTLTWEAPHSLRSIGVIPSVAFFCAVAVQGAWSAAPRAGAGRIAAVGALAALGAAVIGLNFKKYHVDQRTDAEAWLLHSTLETVVAQEALKVPDGTRLVLPDVLVGPPIQEFLAPSLAGTFEVSGLDPLPYRGPATGPVTMFLTAAQDEIARYAARIYPNASLRAITPADYGAKGPLAADPLLYILDLSPADITSVRGLDAGRGVLYAPRDTLYRLWAAEGADIWLDGARVEPGAPVWLAQGNHALTVSPPATLEWQIVGDETREPVPDWALYHDPVAASGLLARLYPNRKWAGAPIIERIDPSPNMYIHLIPLERPYTVEWTGTLLVPETGLYRFNLEAGTAAALTIDGQTVLPLRPGVQYSAPLTLRVGVHSIAVRLLDETHHSHIYLRWAFGEDGPYEPVPREVLLPF